MSRIIGIRGMVKSSEDLNPWESKGGEVQWLLKAGGMVKV